MGEPHKTRTWVLVGSMVAMAIVLTLFVVVLHVVSGIRALDTGWCTRDPSRAICSGEVIDGSTVDRALRLPLVGGVVGLLVGAVGGAQAINRNRAPYPWIALALAPAAAACVTAVLILNA